MSQALRRTSPLGLAASRRVRLATLEECARIAESMVIGGRAWTEEQAIAAKALFACAENIRRRKRG